MSAQSRQRFAALVRAGGAAGDPADVPLDLTAILLAAEALPEDGATGAALEAYVGSSLAALDRLAAAVPADGRDDQRLRSVLAQFRGDEPEDFARLESSLLPAVLDRRRGLPILVGTVWTEVARRAGIPAYGVGLPGHFVVGVGDPSGARVLVDPACGGPLLPYDRARELVAATGRTLRPEHLAPSDPIDTLARILGNIRVWAARRPERARTRLWAAELGLLLPRHDLDLRREHAEALVALGRYAEGAARLEEYAEVVAGPMPLSAEQARRTARQARARLN